MSIRIMYTTDSGKISDPKLFNKNIYELSEKPNGSFRLKWIFPDRKNQQESRVTVLQRDKVIGQIENLSKGSVPVFPVIDKLVDGENCTLQISGIGAITMKLDWSSAELRGVPQLDSFIDWICTECEAIQ